jgi:steroid delta-isomerase-like uncharacterized protein
VAVEQKAGQRPAEKRTAETTATVDESFARDFADRWQKAWNSHDPAEVVALCTEDVIWDDPLTESPERGRAAVTEYLLAVWRAFPDLEFTWPEGPFASFDGTKLALHWRVTGTMLGPMDPPGFAPTGRRIELEGVDLLELRDGLTCAYTGFFDARGVAQQIGALPAPGSRAERVAAAVQRLVARGQRSLGRGPER